MKTKGKSALIFAQCLLLASLCHGQLTDPYEILNRQYNAMGGLDNIKAQKTSYTEGSLELVGTGLSGTIKLWSADVIRKRQEVDLTVFKETSGDNDSFAWTVDMNGKLQLVTDSASLVRRELSIRAANYEFLDKNSNIYTVTYEGVDSINGAVCYKIKTANSLNQDYTTQYIDTSSFLTIKTITVTPDGESHSTVSDYRDIGGVLVPFTHETKQLPTGMIQKFEITKYEVNVDIDPALFEPPGEDIKDYTFADGKSAENIPFKYMNNHIYFEIEVAGKTRLWVLDTGANMTVMMPEFVAELGLEPEGKIKGQGVGNLVNVSFVTMPAFELPGLKFNEQKVAVIDINSLFREWMGFEIAGILGYDFLSRLVIKIDYANELISFYEPDEFEYKGFGKILDVDLAGSEFHVPITIDGKYAGKFNLDIGAGGMSFHYPFAKENGLLDRKGITSQGAGAGGTHLNHSSLFSTVEFGGFEVNNLTFSMPKEALKGGFAGGEIAGNAGNTLFEHFIMYLDYKNKQIILEKGDNFGKNFPRNNSGLRIRVIDDAYTVGFVSPGTPGDKAGFEEEDKLISINEIGCDYLNGVEAINHLFEAPPGTEYIIAIERGGETKELKLKLKDLYE